jgi:hypothetical protein
VVSRRDRAGESGQKEERSELFAIQIVVLTLSGEGTITLAFLHAV